MKRKKKERYNRRGKRKAGDEGRGKETTYNNCAFLVQIEYNLSSASIYNDRIALGHLQVNLQEFRATEKQHLLTQFKRVKHQCREGGGEVKVNVFVNPRSWLIGLRTEEGGGRGHRA